MFARLLALIFVNYVLGAKYNSNATLHKIIDLFNQSIHHDDIKKNLPRCTTFKDHWEKIHMGGRSLQPT